MRIVEPSGLQRDHAEQVHRVEVLRHCGEHLAVRGIGLFEPTGLMVRDRDIQQGGDRRPRADRADLRASSCGDSSVSGAGADVQSGRLVTRSPDWAEATTVASS